MDTLDTILCKIVIKIHKHVRRITIIVRRYICFSSFEFIWNDNRNDQKHIELLRNSYHTLK